MSVLLLAMSGYVALEILLKVQARKDQAAIQELFVSSENVEEGKEAVKT